MDLENKLKLIIEKYNSMQSEKIKSYKIIYEDSIFLILLFYENNPAPVSFYEWLFNPEYNVIELFTVPDYYKLFSFFKSSDDKFSYVRAKNIKEIIDELLKTFIDQLEIQEED